MNTNTKEKAILDALRIDSLPTEEQEELLIEIGEAVFRGSMLRIIEVMDEESQASFKTLLENNGSEEEVAAFISARVPNADALVEETLAELRSDILAVTS